MKSSREMHRETLRLRVEMGNHSSMAAQDELDAMDLYDKNTVAPYDWKKEENNSVEPYDWNKDDSAHGYWEKGDYN